MAKLKIALVEDDEILGKVIKEELEDTGFVVFRASDGQAGLKMIQSKKPNLVLLDLLMPKMKGFDVLEELKQSPATSHIPVIILTMLGRDDDIKKGLQLGANDYIVKSQHAVGEIVEKIQTFFATEQHPEARQSGGQAKKKKEEKKPLAGKPAAIKMSEVSRESNT
jgi:DNA-binding response OmpR family regulator